MKYPTTLIIAALFCSTAAAVPEPVTCDSPCDCHNAHGEGRWSVKTDASLPPTGASAIQAVRPSEMFSWPGSDAPITMQSERTGIENKNGMRLMAALLTRKWKQTVIFTLRL